MKLVTFFVLGATLGCFFVGQDAVAQCTVSGGPSTVCQGQTTSYFSSGCSVVFVSGSGNVRTGSSIYWGAALGSYEVTFSCSSNPTTRCQTVTIESSAISGGTISNSNQEVCSLTSLSDLNLTGYTGYITGWERKRPADPSWTAIGYASNPLPSNYFIKTETYQYRAVVTNNCGNSATSSIATVSVSGLSTYYLNGGATICSGQSVTLSLRNGLGQPTSQSGVRYYLYRDGTQLPGYVGGGADVQWTGISQPGYYTVSGVKENGDCPTWMSSGATVTVVQRPADQTLVGNTIICTGQTTTLGLSATEANTTYTIKRIDNGYNLDFQSITTGSGTGPISFAPISTIGTFTVVSTRSGCTGGSNNLTTSSSTTPAITNLPTTLNKKCGDVVFFTATSDLANTAFAWSSTVQSGSITGHTSGSTATINNTLNGSGQVVYTMTPTGPAPGNCVGASRTLTVNVSPLNTSYLVGGGGTICSNASTTIELKDPTTQQRASEANMTYTLYRNGSPMAGQPTRTGGSTDVWWSGINQAGTYQVYAANGTACSVPMLSSALVTVTQKPADQTLVGSTIVCTGQATTLGLSATEANTTYTIKRIDNGYNLDFQSITTGSGTGPISFAPISTIGTFTVVSTRSGCTGGSNNLTTTSSTTPAITNLPTTLNKKCGDVVFFTATSDLANTAFVWSSAVQSGSVTGNTSGSTATINNTLNGSGQVVYIMTPTGPAPGNCVGASRTLTVNVSPLNTSYLVGGGGTICSNASTTIELKDPTTQQRASEANMTYTLYRNGSPMAGQPTRTGGSTDVWWSGINQAGTYQVYASNGAACSVPMLSSALVSLTPNPANQTLVGSTILCSDQTTTLGLAATEPSTDYTLERLNGMSYVSVAYYSTSPGQSGPISFPPVSVAGTYVVTSSRSGCTGGSNQLSLTLVTSPTPPTFGAIRQFCGFVKISKGADNPNWFWLDNPLSRDESNSALEVSTAQPTVYLGAKGEQGCWTVAQQSVPVINQPPAFTVTPELQTVCEHGKVTFTASGPSVVTFIWYDNASGEMLLMNNGTFETPELSASATFKVTAFDERGCSDNRLVQVNVSPPVTSVPQLPYLTKTGSQFFLHKNNPPAPNITYHWVDDWDGTVSQSHPDPRPVDGGLYYLRARDQFDCFGPTVQVNVPNPKLPSAAITGSDFNYVKSFTYQKKNLTGDPDMMTPEEVMQATQYVDGIGRPFQSVAKAASPEKKDVVTLTYYDNLGRERIKALPYTAQSSTGGVQANAALDHANFYLSGNKIATSDYPVSVTVFDNSPLNQPNEQAAPGEAWAGSVGTVDSRNVKFARRLNTATEVLKFDYNPSTGLVTLPSRGQHLYSANLLFVKTTLDENGNDVLEFVDKDGRTICKKVKANATEYACTYYVYDDLGNLVVVIPPEATKAFDSQN